MLPIQHTFCHLVTRRNCTDGLQVWQETSSIATAAYCSSVFVGETVEWATEKQNVQETFSNSWKCAINQIFILIL